MAENTFEIIERLANEVIDSKIGLVEAILSLPEDFSDCEGEAIALTPEEVKDIANG